MPEVVLKTRGQAFGGWEEIRVSRSMEAVAGSFDLAVSSRRAWPVRPGDSCELWLAGEQVLSGWVDRAEAQIDSAQHRVSVTGRDATADLVDCAPLDSPGEWIGTGLVRIATDIAAAFGVSVASNVDAGEPFPIFGLQPGETAWEAIERACRLRQVLALTDGQGRLVLTGPSTERTAYDLELGQNVLSARATLDLSERFHRYRVRGQHPALAGFDELAIAEPEGEARDFGVRSSRGLEVIAEGALTAEIAAERAAWEATWRAARSASFTVRTAGWQQGGDHGPLWPLNRLVRLRAPQLGVDGTLLIAGVTYTLSEATGSETELQLARRDAWVPRRELEEDGDAAFSLLPDWSADE